MAYRIRPDRPLDQEIRRIAKLNLHRAAQKLDGHKEGDGAVLAARKAIKRVRGLYRLIRDGAPKFYDRENARLRDISAALSSIRESDALVEAAQALRDKMRHDHAADLLLEKLGEALVNRQQIAVTDAGNAKSRISSALAGLRKAADALDRLDLPAKQAKSRAIVIAGFLLSYQHGRENLALALESGQPEDWHDLRKHVKYHRMHLRLLQASWPGVMRLCADAAHLLSDDLGEDHDLWMLQQAAEADRQLVDWPDGMAHLSALIARRIGVLRQQGEIGGRYVFRDAPDLAQDRMNRLWRAAQRAK